MVELNYTVNFSARLLTKLWATGSLMDPKVSANKLALLNTGALGLSSLVVGLVELPAIFITPLLNKSQHPLAHTKNSHPADNGYHQIFAEPADENRQNRAHKVRVGN